MLHKTPTVLWIVGAALSLGALTPVVGQQVTQPSTVDAPPATAATPSQQPTPDAASPSPDGPESPFPTASGTDETGTVVIHAADTRLGTTAVTSTGQTLYLSDLDTNRPPASVCLRKACVTAWKPLYLPDSKPPLPGPGIEANDLGSLRRPDGTWQATLNGWPLYTYAKDTPGDVRGEGIKGIWHAIASDGRRAVK